MTKMVPNGDENRRAARIAVCASGDGSIFEALVEAGRNGRCPGTVVGLIVNRSGIGALARAERLGIPVAVLKPGDFAARVDWDEAMGRQLKEWRADWVVLAGFLTLVGQEVLTAFPRRVVNIHPSLLPKYGGPGMYGLRVHAAVLAAGERETGITVHTVDGQYDRGVIVVQERVTILPGDTPETLGDRVRARERELYPQVLRDLILTDTQPSGTR